ncbi:MAG: hypothetical protein J2P31_19830 [Blastocatellia bacterium]|nr:hypothetical protein [Blastocatellia bacterium]
MKTRSWNLILLPPHGPRIEQIRVSCKAGLILLAAFVLAFIMTVLLLLAFPRIRVNESDRARLDAENQALKIENANLAITIRRLNAQVSRVEERSQRITALMQNPESD